MSIKIIVAIAVVVGTLGIGTGVYFYIYNKGAQSEVVKQERELNELKEKTDAVQDRALTTPDPNNELRKYGRPD